MFFPPNPYASAPLWELAIEWLCGWIESLFMALFARLVGQ